LGDSIVNANFVQFDNDFTGLGVEVGMLLQYIFKSFCYQVSAQAWVKCFNAITQHWAHEVCVTVFMKIHHTNGFCWWGARLSPSRFSGM